MVTGGWWSGDTYDGGLVETHRRAREIYSLRYRLETVEEKRWVSRPARQRIREGRNVTFALIRSGRMVEIFRDPPGRIRSRNIVTVMNENLERLLSGSFVRSFIRRDWTNGRVAYAEHTIESRSHHYYWRLVSGDRDVSTKLIRYRASGIANTFIAWKWRGKYSTPEARHVYLFRSIVSTIFYLISKYRSFVKLLSLILRTNTVNFQSQLFNFYFPNILY